MLPVFNWDRW